MLGPLMSFDLHEADRSSEAIQRNPVALLLHTFCVEGLSRDHRTTSRASRPLTFRNRSLSEGQRPSSKVRDLEHEHDRTDSWQRP